jgi:hypothetical protein
MRNGLSVLRGGGDWPESEADRSVPSGSVIEKLSENNLRILIHLEGKLEAKLSLCLIDQALCNVVVKALCYKPEGREFDTQ